MNAGKDNQVPDCVERWNCPLLIKNPGSYCILHDINPQKNINAFYDAIQFLVDIPNRKFISLKGVVFPGDFELWKLWKDNEGPIFSGPRMWRGTIDLRFSKFLGLLNFSTVTYEGAILLDHATFIGEAWFNDVTFNGKVNFSNVTFQDEAKFINSTFNEKALFLDSTFNKKVTFNGTCFKKDTTFLKVTFMNKVDFAGARFEGETYFDTIFKDDTIFAESTFSSVIFYGRENNLLFSGTKVSFYGATFILPNAVRFHRVDFQHCSLIRTDVRGIDFSGVRWGEFGRWFWKRKIIYEPKHATAEDLENAYRQIRQSYEDRRNYPDAGDFYYGEMDQKRKRYWWRMYLPSLTTMYWLCSGYGQRPFQAGAMLVFLLIGFTGLFLWSGINKVENAPPYISGTGFWTCIWFYTLKVVTFGNPIYFNPQSALTDLLTSIARFIIPVQAALFALAIRRAFKR